MRLFADDIGEFGLHVPIGLAPRQSARVCLSRSFLLSFGGGGQVPSLHCFCLPKFLTSLTTVSMPCEARDSKSEFTLDQRLVQITSCKVFNQ